MPTQIPSGHAMANKEYSVALFASSVRNAWIAKNLTGPAPKQADAERKLKNQTAPGMPVVRITDLSKGAGDTVSVDCVDIVGGKPLMGDRNAEGKGSPLTFSSMDIKIDNTTKVVDAGGKMTQQRAKPVLRGVAMANLAGYMQRLETQTCLVHMAGGRGTNDGLSWAVPLSTDADFSEIVVNTVKAPTYNRHFVTDDSATGKITQGGAQLASMVAADVLKLECLDTMRKIIDDMEFKMQPVRIADDPARDDEPLYVLLCPPRAYSHLLTEATASNNVRAFQQNAWNRASHGSKHPLFRGEVGIWNGILVKKIEWSIRHALDGATDTKMGSHVTAANRYTATETSNTYPTVANTSVERCLLLGAQALGHAYGRGQGSDYYYSWLERWYNFERNLEVAAESMGGKAKLRFSIPDGLGNTEPTDHGVLVLDTAVYTG